MELWNGSRGEDTADMGSNSTHTYVIMNDMVAGDKLATVVVVGGGTEPTILAKIASVTREPENPCARHI